MLQTLNNPIAKLGDLLQPRNIALMVVAVVCVTTLRVSAEESGRENANAENAAPSESRTIAPEFDRFRPLIGVWRGVGQVRRGSTRGAWKEQAEWRFDFSEDTPSVVLDVEDGTHVGRLIVRVNDGVLAAELVTADEQTIPLTVDTSEDRKTTFVSPSNDTLGYRLTATSLNEKRTLLLIESRPEGTTRFRRLGEVGYTREGTKLATAGGNGPECIVTGGKGTIQVSYKGESYYVCCTGCKQAFDADPEAIIAEWKTRQAEKLSQTSESP